MYLPVPGFGPTLSALLKKCVTCEPTVADILKNIRCRKLILGKNIGYRVCNSYLDLYNLARFYFTNHKV